MTENIWYRTFTRELASSKKGKIQYNTFIVTIAVVLKQSFFIQKHW
jgi:hypothetical protein